MPSRSAAASSVVERAGEGVADQRDLGHPMPLDEIPQFVGVERPAAQQHHRATHHERPDRQEQCRSVHQWGRAEHDRAAAVGLQLCRDPAHVLDGRGHLDARGHVGGERERAEEIDMTPHHALRVAGRAARVEHQGVLARPFDPLGGRRRCDDVVVPLGAADERGPVVDLEQDANSRHRGHRFGDAIAERAVEDENLGTGVVADVGDLGRLVPVVDVDRRGAQLERRIGRFEVLGAVEHQLGDSSADADATLTERAGEPRRSIVEFSPGQRVLADDDGNLIRLRVGKRLPQGRPVLAQYRATVGHRSPSARHVSTATVLVAPSLSLSRAGPASRAAGQISRASESGRSPSSERARNLPTSGHPQALARSVP